MIHQFLLRAGDHRRLSRCSRPTISPRSTTATAVFSDFNFHIDPVVDIDRALAARGVRVEWRGASA